MTDKEEKAVWHQDEDFWHELAPFMFTDELWEHTPTQATQALDLMNLQSPGAFLDLACGPGRLSLELARRGFQVTGVDRTEAYLKQAEASACSEGLEIEFILEDMRNFRRLDAFDGAWSVFTSFGYFDPPEENQLVLDNIYESLKPGGVLLIDLIGREVLARKFQQRDWREIDGVFLLEDRNVEMDWTRMRNSRVLIKGDKRIEFEVTHYIYSGDKLTDMLYQSEFSSVQLFGSLEGAPYDLNARRLVAVARK